MRGGGWRAPAWGAVLRPRWRRREALTDRCDRAHFPAALPPRPPPPSLLQTRVRMAHTDTERARAALGHRETYLLDRGGEVVVAPRPYYMLCAAWVYPPPPRATVHPARAARLAAPWETAQGTTSSCPVVVRRPGGAATAPLAAIFRLHRLSGAVRRGGVGRFLVHCRHLFGDASPTPTNTAGQVRMPGAPAYIHGGDARQPRTHRARRYPAALAAGGRNPRVRAAPCRASRPVSRRHRRRGGAAEAPTRAGSWPSRSSWETTAGAGACSARRGPSAV